MSVITDIIGGVVKPISDIYQSHQAAKQRQAELEDAAHARTLEQIEKTEELEQALTLAQINQSGWRDDWFTYLFSIPLIGAFIPKLVPYIIAGFSALDGMPVWYKAYLGAAVTSAFGLSTVNKVWKWWNT